MEQNLDKLAQSSYPIDWHFLDNKQVVSIADYAKNFGQLEAQNAQLDRPFSKMDLVFMHMQALLRDAQTAVQIKDVFFMLSGTLLI